MSRVEVYPGSFLRLTGTTGATRHLMVLKGVAEIITDGKTMPLTANQSLQFAGDGKIHIENTGGERLQLVLVQIGDLTTD